MNSPNVPELSPSATPADFESFKAELVNMYDPAELPGLLQQELTDRAERLLDVYASPDMVFEDRRKAVFDYGIAAIAHYGLVYPDKPSHNPYEPLPGVDFARTCLTEYAGGDPLQTSLLERTAFFSPDERVRRGLGEMISASVTPWGDYNDQELAAGIVSKRVFAQLL
ncbi:MAG TPA: hypothetical protein VM535_00400 [Candidatus Saccharimonadales bacterium]|nr:hypothetical protein [Candidatus Saccharimonadales bacterium]